MKCIKLSGEDIEFSVSIETLLTKLREELGLIDLVTYDGEVGYYEDVGTHNSDYVFHPEYSSKKHLKVLQAIEVLEKALIK